MNEYKINKISQNNEIFRLPAYLDDQPLFNYIEGAKTLSDSELYSDSSHVIICRKKDHKNVWIWTDNDSYDNVELVIEIAKTIRGFNITKPQFFTKTNIAQIFSDMYALVSADLDYHIKDEFSLGAYKYTISNSINNDDIAIVQYNKKHFGVLEDFYNELSEEFSWEDGTVAHMCKQCENLNTYLLFKNGEILSLCSVSDSEGEYSFIRSIATKKAHRNNGYGSIVVNFAALSTAKKGKELMVYVNKGNPSANATLKKSGFKLVGDIHLIKS